MKFTIFREGEQEERNDRHRLIHFIWKFKIFYPVIFFLDKYIKKFIIKKIEDIPDEVYNRNFKILYFAMEKGIEDWYYNFYGGIKNGKKDEKKYAELAANWPNREKYHWFKIPMYFVRLLITIILEDTAYRELTNCFMMRLQGEMNRNWNPEIKHRFPMYLSMRDGFLPFFVEWMRIQGGGMLKVDAEPIKVQLQTKERVDFKLNKEAADRIKSLGLKDRKRFIKELDQFIIHLLGQERLRLCPGCRKDKKIEMFNRPGTTNTEFLICTECAYLKAQKIEVKK